MARRMLVAAATADQASGSLPARVAPSDIAEQCLALIEGSGLLATIERGPEDAAETLRRIIGRYLDGLHHP